MIHPSATLLGMHIKMTGGGGRLVISIDTSQEVANFYCVCMCSATTVCLTETKVRVTETRLRAPIADCSAGCWQG